jgi:hypothetical protein
MQSLFQHAAYLLLLTPLASPAQQATPAQAMAMQQYERTTPYIDLPIPQLTKAIKELNGLKAQPDSGQLDTILQQTGDAINAQLPRVPNLLCREEVAEETKPQVSAPTSVRISGSPGASTMQAPTAPDQWSTGDSHRFEYIIRTSKEEDGSITLEETRQGKGPAVAAPKGTGFAALWMIFASGNRTESTFRYLGTQKVDGRPTQVIAFAQIPDKVRKPALIDTGAGTVPLLYQGFAWIDAENFHILRLRTDLRAPLPELNLKRITSTIDFSKVTIPQFPDALWLPKRVEVLWQTNEVEAGEIHRYSKYQLFHATARIVP